MRSSGEEFERLQPVKSTTDGAGGQPREWLIHRIASQHNDCGNAALSTFFLTRRMVIFGEMAAGGLLAHDEHERRGR